MVAMAAGIATLTELKERSPYDRLDAMSAKIESGITAAAKKLSIPYQFNRLGSMWTLFFTGTPVTNLDTAKTSDTAKFAKRVCADVLS